MGTKANHKKKARHNQEFLTAINAKDFPDWAVTVSFYKALHLVEMLFAADGRHSSSHFERHQILKKEFPEVWMQYRPLYEQSHNGRYATASKIHPQTVAYVQGRLERVEQLIDAALAAGSKPPPEQ